MKHALLILLSLLFLSCSHVPWDDADRALYATLVASQVFDYATTESLIDRGGYIVDTWSWKYGSDQPSDSTLALVKLGELGLALLIADIMPPDIRKAFLGGCSVILLGYGISNTWR